MRGGSPVRVRFVAEWLEGSEAGVGLAVGDRVACPYAEMLVRGVARRRVWRGNRSSGEEVVVWLAPDLVGAGSRYRVRCELPGRPVRWPSGTVFSDPARVVLDETRGTLDEALDAVVEFAEADVSIPRSHTTDGAWVTLSALDPGEEGSGRTLIRLRVGEGGLGSLLDALERLCDEAELRFGEAANQTPAGPAATGRVRFVTEWLDDGAASPEFAEGDRVALPDRDLVVRRLGNEERIGDALTTWWVSTEAAPMPPLGIALAFPSSSRPRGDELVAEIGRGLIDPGSTLHIAGSARVGGGVRRDDAEDLDMAVPTVEEALDAVAVWADAIAVWAGAQADRVERLAGHVKLYALEDTRESGRLLAAAGIGSAEGLDAFLEMLDAFCAATASRYGGTVPAVDASADGAGEGT